MRNTYKIYFTLVALFISFNFTFAADGGDPSLDGVWKVTHTDVFINGNNEEAKQALKEFVETSNTFLNEETIVFSSGAENTYNFGKSDEIVGTYTIEDNAIIFTPKSSSNQALMGTVHYNSGDQNFKMVYDITNEVKSSEALRSLINADNAEYSILYVKYFQKD